MIKESCLNSEKDYNKSVGSLATAIPVIHYLLRGKWWTDKRRESLRELTAFFLFRSIIFNLYSRNRIVVWTISMNSEREIELKSFMNSFIKSPSFPKLRKSNLKNNESNNDPSGRATAVNKKSYISNIAENWKKPRQKLKKVRLQHRFSDPLM